MVTDSFEGYEDERAENNHWRGFIIVCAFVNSFSAAFLLKMFPIAEQYWFMPRANPSPSARRHKTASRLAAAGPRTAE